MHLWFSWQMWSSAHSQAIPWWPHMCGGRLESTVFQLHLAPASNHSEPFFSIHFPSAPPSLLHQALAWIGWTHPLVQKPPFHLEDSQDKWERCADRRDHLFYYGMALPQHSIKLFSVKIRPNSGSFSSHGCQDHIEKHLAGQLEVIGLALQEIHFQPCVPGSHLLFW